VVVLCVVDWVFCWFWARAPAVRNANETALIAMGFSNRIRVFS
jgi:hypothetical protein